MKTAKEMLEISNEANKIRAKHAGSYAASKLEHYNNLIEEEAVKGGTWIRFQLPNDHILDLSCSSDEKQHAIILLLERYGYRVVGNSCGIQGITWTMLEV